MRRGRRGTVGGGMAGEGRGGGGWGEGSAAVEPPSPAQILLRTGRGERGHGGKGGQASGRAAHWPSPWETCPPAPLGAICAPLSRPAVGGGHVLGGWCPPAARPMAGAAWRRVGGDAASRVAAWQTTGGGPAHSLRAGGAVVAPAALPLRRRRTGRRARTLCVRHAGSARWLRGGCGQGRGRGC